MTDFSGKRILITGSCGTVGSELLRQLIGDGKYQPAGVTCIDNNESQLFFQEQRYLDDPRVTFFVADIRDRDTVMRQMDGIDIVFHTAALKHVVMCERSPMDAVQTNIHGVQNVIQAAIDCGVEKVIFTSSDKAVNPTNVMGTSKIMGERLITAANSVRRRKEPIFASTRFGNVLGSRGSVISIFRNQISHGGPLTLTDPEMTRFIMSIEQSARLVIESSMIAKGGEVFITKMPVVRITDLARVMIDEIAPLYEYDPKDIAFEHIGTKPGEKLYEELMSDEETRRAMELEKYYVVMPAFTDLYRDIDYRYDEQLSRQVTRPYNSARERPLTRAEIRHLLDEYGLLETKGTDVEGELVRRYWPGDKEAKAS